MILHTIYKIWIKNIRLSMKIIIIKIMISVIKKLSKINKIIIFIFNKILKNLKVKINKLNYLSNNLKIILLILIK